MGDKNKSQEQELREWQQALIEERDNRLAFIHAPNADNVDVTIDDSSYYDSPRTTEKGQSNILLDWAKKLKGFIKRRWIPLIATNTGWLLLYTL